MKMIESTLQNIDSCTDNKEPDKKNDKKNTRHLTTSGATNNLILLYELWVRNCVY